MSDAEKPKPLYLYGLEKDGQSYRLVQARLDPTADGGFALGGVDRTDPKLFPVAMAQLTRAVVEQTHRHPGKPVDLKVRQAPKPVADVKAKLPAKADDPVEFEPKALGKLKCGAVITVVDGDARALARLDFHQGRLVGWRIAA